MNDEATIEAMLQKAGVWGWAYQINNGRLYSILIPEWDTEGYTKLVQDRVSGLKRQRYTLPRKFKPVNVSYDVYEFTVELVLSTV